MTTITRKLDAFFKAYVVLDKILIAIAREAQVQVAALTFVEQPKLPTFVFVYFFSSSFSSC